VLDEAHMLTEPAFNALLKRWGAAATRHFYAGHYRSAQDPGDDHVRCQRFDFKRIPVRAIVERLEVIAGKKD